MTSHDTIVLLTSNVEFSYLCNGLLVHAPELAVEHVSDIRGLEDFLGQGRSGRVRLIAFCSGVIVPPGLLDKMSGGAYNFHPAPPDYPGSHAAGFALYNGADRFGVTAHVMAETIDAGSIVGVDFFDVPPDSDREGLEITTYQAMLGLFDRMAPQMADLTDEPAPVAAKWTGTKTKARDVTAMFQGWDVLDDAERLRRARAFGMPDEN